LATHDLSTVFLHVEQWFVISFPCPSPGGTITTGKLVIDVKYFFFNVYSETDDICTKTACPATDKFKLSHSQTLPSVTPPGTYTITMKMLGKKDEELSCISFKFSIGLFSPVALS
jgi:hypothetical protein